MIKRILCAVDGSVYSLHAPSQVLGLARSLNSRVIVVSVVPAYDGDLRLMGHKHILEDMRQPFEKALRSAGEMASSCGVKFESVLAEGEPHEEIVNLSEELKADVTVVGRRGGHHYLDLIPVGSVASRVIESCGNDVLIIPKAIVLETRKILLAFDGSADSEKASQKAVALSIACGSELVIATVYEVPLEGFALAPNLWAKISHKAARIQSSAVERAKAEGVARVESVLRHGHSAHELCDVAHKNDIGLIVMGARGMSGVRRVLMGRVLERVVSCSPAAVWVVKTDG